MIEVLVAVVLVVPLMTWILLPENRQRRADKSAYRALERLQRQPHQHEWGRWGEPEERKIYAAGVTRGETENRLPIRRDTYQHRECTTCGEVEQRVF